MRSFWLFRTNLKALEYYHQYKDLETFEKNCHDFYLLQGLWFLRNDYFDEVIIWRLSKKDIPPTIFNVNGKKFSQIWVKSFEQTLEYPKPKISFWRGGFPEYDRVTKAHPKFFGKKLYLGAGRRITPQWGGKYSALLMEDEKDFKKGYKCLPFYKTASPEIFKPPSFSYLDYDICWPCNFKQITQKGQEFFIRSIGKSKKLKQLRIVHCGNSPKAGKTLCKKYGVKNIEFMGSLERLKLNEVLNKSKFGIVTSNRNDGCPRILTEILMSGTPLLVRNKTRFLEYYKGRGVIVFNDENITNKIIYAIEDRKQHYFDIKAAIKNELSFSSICEKNINLWKKMGGS
ncbi:MAG: glycosyltransferase [Candidatus Thorarchaeota archaeon]|jgi:hypothetical protein